MSPEPTTKHRCPRNGCKRMVPRHMLMCSTDWYKVPAALRKAVWAAYEHHGIGSPEHTGAIQAAIAAVNNA